MEQINEPSALSYSFEFRLKPGRALPQEYTLVLGVRGAGSVLAKSLEGVVAVAAGEVIFKNGAPLARVFVAESRALVVVSFETELPVDHGEAADCIKGGLLAGAISVVVLESVPWSYIRTFGHCEATLGASEERNCLALYEQDEQPAIPETLGATLFTALKSRPTKYFLAILFENALGIQDLREVAAWVREKAQLGAVENKLKSNMKLLLQESAYL